jgi:hypothetical protein
MDHYDEHYNRQNAERLARSAAAVSPLPDHPHAGGENKRSDNMNRKMTFDEWMKAVDAVVQHNCGMTSSDLPDVCYADWYDEGDTPGRAASRAIRSALEDWY